MKWKSISKISIGVGIRNILSRVLIAQKQLEEHQDVKISRVRDQESFLSSGFYIFHLKALQSMSAFISLKSNIQETELCNHITKVISTMRDELREFPTSSPSERDSDVLDIITQEALLKFTFDGLKRRLGMHPETLSRILNRLEEEGFLKKSSEGYTVTSRIQDYSSTHLIGTDKNQVSLLQTFIPTNVSTEQLVQSLRGKWFGMLRWLGFAQNDGVVTLKWVTEDSTIQVNANIWESTLTITAKFLQENDMDKALSASYQLITHISQLCQRKHIFQHVGYYGDYGFFHMPA